MSSSPKGNQLWEQPYSQDLGQRLVTSEWSFSVEFNCKGRVDRKTNGQGVVCVELEQEEREVIVTRFLKTFSLNIKSESKFPKQQI